MKKILCSLLCLVLTACAPGLKDSISISAYPVPPSSLEDSIGRGKIGIKEVIDDRSNPAVCTISGREVVGETNPTISVRMAAEQYLKAHGYMITQFKSPVRLTIHIKKWNVEVKPKFPMNEISAQATIGTEVFKDDVKKLTGTYSGMASAKEPFGSQRVIEETLGRALGEALTQMVKDEKMAVIAR
jgi:hypothetical protein